MQRHIRKVAILGISGVMGSQIAALLIGNNIQVIGFDLPGEKHPNEIAARGIQFLKKLKPTPYTTLNSLDAIQLANYRDDLELLKDCNVIIEAVAERMDIKKKLYTQIQDYISPHAILASNTSGLSIHALAENFSEDLKKRFLGIHFFNPPFYMMLVEMIAHSKTDPKILACMETFLVSTLGKGVIHAKDTPNFIANRIGVFAFILIMHHAKIFNIAPEVVDALTGTLIGHPKSATYRTLDVIGLDTTAHVIYTMQENLKQDPWHAYFTIPDWMILLIEKKLLGQKTGAGVYRKNGKEIEVFNFTKQDYQPMTEKADAEVIKILKIKNVPEKFAALRASKHPHAQFLWSYYRDLFHYCAYHLEQIAENVRDIDLAMRWGFAWQQGPFETWQNADWQKMLSWINEDIAAGKALVKQALPNWTSQLKMGGYQQGQAYAPKKQQFEPRSHLPVYKKQLFPETVLTEQHHYGETIYENEDMRCWQQGDDIAIVSFKTKMNTFTDKVLQGLIESIEIAEQKYKGLIIWQNQGTDFSAGANLLMLLEAMRTYGAKAVEKIILLFQQAAMRLRYAMVPTVAAVRGRALGGGCEMALHAARRVATQKTYIGLVEIGVGLIPAGGGLKEFAYKISQTAQKRDFPKLIEYFKQIAMAEVSISAENAVERGFFNQHDVIITHPDELLYAAKAEINALHEQNYRPPLPARFAVAGKQGIADLQTLLVNYHTGKFITDYDLEIATQIAKIICGGEVEMGSIVDEEWILKLEIETFMKLCAEEKTQQRIKHMLETGKPLRN